jgi:4-hydroxy-tetrahydrodipicolinate reductase
MGSAVCAAIALDPELELVAAVDPYAAGQIIEGMAVSGEPKAFVDAGAEVVVDFSVADAARRTVLWLAMHGIHAVVGTTGLTDEDLETFAHEFGDDDAPNCAVVPNFSISAVLMMRCAELAAPFFESVEVIEMHHDAKIDAPSGTAVHTLERLAAASSDWSPDPTTRQVVEGARGGKGPGDIPVHSVRLRGLFAHQEVLFGTTGQMLTIRHDAYDRSSMMPGVLLAVKRVAENPGVTVGLEALLGL